MNNWISVKDRLPEKTHPDHRAKRYICYLHPGIVEMLIYLFDTKIWTDNGCDTFDVTHWQPLPPPPTEQDLSNTQIDLNEINRLKGGGGMKKILPCPFCGSLRTYFDYNQGTKWGFVVCADCLCHGPETRTNYDIIHNKWHNKAIEEWNTREGNQ